MYITKIPNPAYRHKRLKNALFFHFATPRSHKSRYKRTVTDKGGLRMIYGINFLFSYSSSSLPYSITVPFVSSSAENNKKTDLEDGRTGGQPIPRRLISVVSFFIELHSGAGNNESDASILVFFDVAK